MYGALDIQLNKATSSSSSKRCTWPAGSLYACLRVTAEAGEFLVVLGGPDFKSKQPVTTSADLTRCGGPDFKSKQPIRV